MAVSRQIPKCIFCGKEIAKGVYKDESHLPLIQRTIGDTFIGWELVEHDCIKTKLDK